ncbi:MAG: lysine 2,3-aminomutase, partial [Gemmatimonadales bacterium]
MNAFPANLTLESPPGPRYKPYTLRNVAQLEQFQSLPEDLRFAVRVVGEVLPFRTNNYVVEQLINWSNVPQDPMFVLNFPQREMLSPAHFDTMARLIRREASREEIRAQADRIRLELRPHPAGQLEANRPEMEGHTLRGMQHKYRETVLFFPSQGQTCHAYCSFCFRWPQFVGMDELKIAMNESETLVQYLRAHPEVSDVLFTGGDPLIMRTKTLAGYIEPLLRANLPNLRTIRIGTKALSYWPYRFLTDPDAEQLLDLFERVAGSGRHVAIMAHF